MSASPSLRTMLDAAISAHRAGRLAGAEAGYRQALSLESGNPAALHRVGIPWQQTGRHGEAPEFLRAAIEAVPTSTAYRGSLAAALGQQGSHGEAAELLAEAARLEPGNALIHNNLGVALENTDQPAAAAEAYRRAIALTSASSV